MTYWRLSLNWSDICKNRPIKKAQGSCVLVLQFAQHYYQYSIIYIISMMRVIRTLCVLSNCKSGLSDLWWRYFDRASRLVIFWTHFHMVGSFCAVYVVQFSLFVKVCFLSNSCIINKCNRFVCLLLLLLLLLLMLLLTIR